MSSQKASLITQASLTKIRNMFDLNMGLDKFWNILDEEWQIFEKKYHVLVITYFISIYTLHF